VTIKDDVVGLHEGVTENGHTDAVLTLHSHAVVASLSSTLPEVLSRGERKIRGTRERDGEDGPDANLSGGHLEALVIKNALSLLDTTNTNQVNSLGAESLELGLDGIHDFGGEDHKSSSAVDDDLLGVQDAARQTDGLAIYHNIGQVDAIPLLISDRSPGGDASISAEVSSDTPDSRVLIEAEAKCVVKLFLAKERIPETTGTPGAQFAKGQTDNAVGSSLITNNMKR
jgi:hypothetical protein